MITRRITLSTGQGTGLIDLTSRLDEEVAAAGLRRGRLHLHSLHTTLGLILDRMEPVLLDDLIRFNGEASNGHHADGGRGRLLLRPGITALVEDGRLLLGRRQAILAVELDGPRSRELALQLEGEFSAAPTDRELELVELELRRQLLCDPDPMRLPMARLVEAGGKRLRPMVVVLASRLGPAHDPLRAAVLGAAVELIHDATMVHDDYVDEAATRRGRPAVAVAEGPARAIEVGDYYFARATRMIAELGDDEVTRTIAGALETICLSQIDEVALRGSYPGDHATYLQVVRGKTAALIAAACEAGARLGGGGIELAARVARYGELLGIAFQMVDDLLDYSDASGKPIGTDIRQRTLSLPLIYAYEDERAGPLLRRLFAGELDEEAVVRVQELVRQCGALERVAAEARSLIASALEELSGLDPDRGGAALAEIAKRAVDRVS
ncbi:MAG TPA: polyprenyl synthetase family protein [Candidatus Dormibacteraeota bacterium]|nr:polyprenyl synthetase family protein [Candidatus Dormibacteraeota bacterium]